MASRSHLRKNAKAQVLGWEWRGQLKEQLWSTYKVQTVPRGGRGDVCSSIVMSDSLGSMDCNLPDSSVHLVLQASGTQVNGLPCPPQKSSRPRIFSTHLQRVGRFLYHWATGRCRRQLRDHEDQQNRVMAERVNLQALHPSVKRPSLGF